jgi:ubiquinone/menaquinone biosynthesis C-methylase UbiE
MLDRAGCLLNKHLIEQYQPWVNPVLAHMFHRQYGSDTQVIIDMGTGPGFLSLELARLFPAEVYAVDYNPEMLAIATELFKQAQISNVIPLMNDVHQLTFANDCTDMLVSYSCFHHWADPVTGLRECYRVLRPGGTMVLIDSLPAEDTTLKHLQRKFNHPEVFALLEKAIQESYTKAAVAQMAREAGITQFWLDDFRCAMEDIIACIDVIDDSMLFDPAFEDVSLSWIIVIEKSGTTL